MSLVDKALHLSSGFYNKPDKIYFSVFLSLQEKKSSGTTYVVFKHLCHTPPVSKCLTAQEVAFVVFTMVTPFERRESSSSLINENRLFASKEWLFAYLGEQELGVAAITD